MEQLNMFTSFSVFNNFNKPLAARMRPRTVDEFVGQRHLLDKGKVLRQMIDNDNVGSMIFWGPPGSGENHIGEHNSQYHKGEVRGVFSGFSGDKRD